MCKKNRILLSLLLAGVLTVTPIAVYAAEEQSFPSYAGQEHILPLQTADTAYRTTTAVEKNHVLRENDLKAVSYRFENSKTYFYDGDETEVLSWTDQNYVQVGDVVLTLKSTVDEVDLAQKELQLKRETESHQTQCELYLKQIEHKQKTVESLTGTEREIALLECQKLQAAYEKYRISGEASLSALSDEIEQMKQNRQSSVVRAERAGYLYLPNEKLSELEDRPVLHRNEAMFAILSPGGASLTLTDQVPVGVTDEKQGARVVCDPNLGYAQGVSFASTVVYDSDILTEEVLDLICGVERKGKWTPKFTFAIPIIEDAVALKTSLVFDDQGNMLFSLLQNGTSFDPTARYYVKLLRDGMEQKQYVQLGPVVEDTVIILSGVSDGDLVIM